MSLSFKTLYEHKFLTSFSHDYDIGHFCSLLKGFIKPLKSRYLLNLRTKDNFENRCFSLSFSKPEL